MIRTYASLEQSLALAKYYGKQGVKSTDVKASLEASKYQVKLGGQVLNFDYRIVEAMVYAMASCTVEAKPAKPKRTVKAKASVIPAI